MNKMKYEVSKVSDEDKSYCYCKYGACIIQCFES